MIATDKVPRLLAGVLIVLIVAVSANGSSEPWLENDTIRLECDPTSGAIRSIFDKATGSVFAPMAVCRSPTSRRS
jgi:hypothetical protein